MALFSNIELMINRPQIFEALWSATPIVVVDLEAGDIRAASPPFLAAFGYDAASIDGQTIDRLIPGTIRRAVATPDAVGVRRVGHRRDGTVFPVAANFAPVMMEGDARPVAVAIVVDVTEAAAA